MASAEIRPGTYSEASKQIESNPSAELLAARERAIHAFSQNLTDWGPPPTAYDRFRGEIFTRDAATALCQAMEKPQNGELDVIAQAARRTLLTVAEHQGKKFDKVTREQPGAMTHELLVGGYDGDRFAKIAGSESGRWVNQRKSYRGLDPTFWWGILLHDYVQITGDFALLERLWPNFEAAVSWAGQFGAGPIKGGFENGKPPRNLGWKDSENPFIDEEGNFPAYPVAPLDVNVVAVAADRRAARLYELKENYKKAGELRSRADARMEMVNNLFWLEEFALYAPALDASGDPVRIRTSDSVYALWAGVTDGRSELIAKSLLESDLFIKGRALRTRSTFSRQFSTNEYQNGNPWYHLAPMAGAACEKLGLAEEAGRFDGCLPTIVKEGFPELDCAGRDNIVFPYTEKDQVTGEEKPVGCKNFTMTIGGVLNRLSF